MTYANDLLLVSMERSLYVYKHINIITYIYIYKSLLATLTLWLHIMIAAS